MATKFEQLEILQTAVKHIRVKVNKLKAELKDVDEDYIEAVYLPANFTVIFRYMAEFENSLDRELAELKRGCGVTCGCTACENSANS